MKVEMWMDFVCPYCYLGKAKWMIKESQHIGVDVVPFFLFNKKYTVAGAQSIVTIRKALEKALIK